jgi:multisubunit Na+/H+ antiporter MnhC subunit
MNARQRRKHRRRYGEPPVVPLEYDPPPPRRAPSVVEKEIGRPLATAALVLFAIVVALVIVAQLLMGCVKRGCPVENGASTTKADSVETKACGERKR